MKYLFTLSLALAVIFPTLVHAQVDETAAEEEVGGEVTAPPAEEAPVAPEEPEDPDEKKKSVAHHVIMYIPNRLFDVVDIVRLKIGVGPGLTVAARVTDVGDVWVGGHTTAWVGLPGARQKPKLPLPVGVESRVGAELSVINLTAEAGEFKTYPPDEIGADVHLLIAGGGGGVSVWEALDCVLGILFIDISGDDL